MFVIVKEFQGQKDKRHFVILKEVSWTLEAVVKEAELMIQRGDEKELFIYELQGGVRLAPAQAIRIGSLSDKLAGESHA